MKNKEAKLLMLNCIREGENGECFILNRMSIKTSTLDGGPTLSRETYVGHIGMEDEPNIKIDVREFCKNLNLSKKETERAIATYPKEYVPVKSDCDEF